MLLYTKRVMSKSTLIVVFFALLLMAVATNQVSAHATLESTTPAQNSVVSHPQQIELHYNEPVNTKYSSITIFDDKGKSLGEFKPTNSGTNQTLTFDVGQLDNGTHKVSWHTTSADGHEIQDEFEFSINKKTTSNIDVTPPFYETSNFWFGLFRFITEGSLIVLMGSFLVNSVAKRYQLPTYLAFFSYKPISWILSAMAFITAIIYIMTLSPELVSNIMALDMTALLQAPFLLAMIAIIVLLLLFTLNEMMTIWYIAISLIIIVTLSMSGHVWAQSFPLWSIILRSIHLLGMALWLGGMVYLVWLATTKQLQDIVKVKRFFFKLNLGAVIALVISGVLMAIDETSLAAIWSSVTTWSSLFYVKIIGTILMITLGGYQSFRALTNLQKVNKKVLYCEIIIGIMLVLAGIIMSQIQRPS